MKSRKNNSTQGALFFSLGDTLNQKHPLYQLSHKIDWQCFEDGFGPLYCPDNGRPAKPIRLMCGLLILKHVRNLSDESLVEQWSENSYYQYFCGQTQFIPAYPCDASELVYFRRRIGEKGMELILRESIRVNNDNGDSDDPTVFIDSTVQEKNVTYPTDAKLHRKIIRKCTQIAQQEQLSVRQSYTRTLKELAVDQRFRNHPKNKSKARKADRRVRTIASRLVRELERNLPQDSPHRVQLDLFLKVLSQQRGDKHKIYSIHEPDVQCISKGKEHKKYEFGNKVSIMWNARGVIVGALSFRNEYDGHTLPAAVEQAERLTGRSPERIAGDRGYRGTRQVGRSRVMIPGKPTRNQSRYERSKLRKMFRQRAGIEPIIGHLKSNHRLGRNFYKGITGDAVNIMLAAAAFNFKRAMRKLESILSLILNLIKPQNKLDDMSIVVD